MGISPRKRKNRNKAKRILQRFKRFNAKTGRFENKETKIEVIIRHILMANDIRFIQEKIIPFLGSYKKYDFYCWEEDKDGNRLWEFFIEAHGTYFHAKEYVKKKVTRRHVNLMQKKNVKNDQIKINLAKKINVPLIVFWEDTIRNSPTYVRNILLRKIKELKTREDKTFFYEDY